MTAPATTTGTPAVTPTAPRKKRPLLLKLLAGFAAVVALLAIVVALQPSEFRVTRSASITAPPATVFALVNDFRAWDAWSPWAKRDPAAKSTFEGPPTGEGAVFGWSGNAEVGEGRMTITESRPDELVRLRLEFVKPFEDACDTEFAFAPEGDGTQVTWTMSGENDFFSKAVCLAMAVCGMDMDTMVGGDFEAGLANMKAVAEAKAGG